MSRPQPQEGPPAQRIPSAMPAIAPSENSYSTELSIVEGEIVGAQGVPESPPTLNVRAKTPEAFVPSPTSPEKASTRWRNKIVEAKESLLGPRNSPELSASSSGTSINEVDGVFSPEARLAEVSTDTSADASMLERPSSPSAPVKSFSLWSAEAPADQKSEQPLYAPADPASSRSDATGPTAPTAPMSSAPSAPGTPISSSSRKSYSPWKSESSAARKSEQPLYAPADPASSRSDATAPTAPTAPMSSAPSAPGTPSSSSSSRKSYSPWKSESSSAARKSELLYVPADPASSRSEAAAPTAPKASTAARMSEQPPHAPDTVSSTTQLTTKSQSTRNVDSSSIEKAVLTTSSVLTASDHTNVLSSPLRKMKHAVLERMSPKRRVRGVRWWSIYTITIWSVYGFVNILTTRLIL